MNVFKKMIHFQLTKEKMENA